MSKPPKKPKIAPEWEDEITPTKTGEKKLTAEEEAQLFHDAVRFGHIPEKDRELPTQDKISRPIKKTHKRFDIDLHGMTVQDAQSYVIRAIQEILDGAKGQMVEIRVITGKGHRSKDRAPQLIHSIHHVVESKFKHRLISIEVSPHELKLGDTYLKGHFDLKIR